MNKRLALFAFVFIFANVICYAATTQTFEQYINSKPNANNAQLEKLHLMAVQNGQVVHYSYSSAVSNPFKNYTSGKNANEINALRFRNLSTAIQSVNASGGGTILVSTPNVINNKTKPTNVEIRIVKGGSIDVASGKTFNWNGGKPIAGYYPIFSGAGIVNGIVAETIPVIWYGAIGSGDETVAIQSALENKQLVIGQYGVTYTVSKRPGQYYALLWKSGMKFDTRGATIKLANNQTDCALLMTETALNNSASVTDTYLRGIFDGNEQNQGTITIAGTWFKPTLYLNNIADSDIDVAVKNGFKYALYVGGSDSLIYRNKLNCRVDGARGGGVSLNGSEWNIGTIWARNIVHVEPTNVQGNPFIVNITKSQIGRVYAENYGYGIKFQNACENLTIGEIIGIGGANNEAVLEALVKFQGTSSASRNKNITVGSITLKDAPTLGLYLYGNQNLSINSVTATNMSYLMTAPGGSPGGYIAGIFAGSYNSDVHIGAVSLSEPNQYGITLNNADAGGKINVAIDTFQSTSTNSNKLSDIYCVGQNPYLTINNFHVKHTRVKEFFTLNPAGIGNITVNNMYADIDLSAFISAAQRLITAASTSNLVVIKSAQFPGYKQVQEVNLTNSASSTTVTSNLSFFKVGSDIGALIDVVPANSNAKGLAGGYIATPIEMSSGGGFTISHGAVPASGTYTVLVKHNGFIGRYLGL